MKSFPQLFGFSISHTTRKPRPNEVDGEHYHFTSRDVIQQEIDDGKFVEFAEVHGNIYGTSFESVQNVRSQGKVCLLDIDVQGVRNVKNSTLKPKYMFVAPPNNQVLEERLRDRATEKEEDIIKRLNNATKEIEYGMEDGNFDYILKNIVLEESFNEMKGIFTGWYPHLLVSKEPETKEESKD